MPEGTGLSPLEDKKVLNSTHMIFAEKLPGHSTCSREFLF